MNPAPFASPRMAGTRPAVVMLARSPLAAGKTRLTVGCDDPQALALRTALFLDSVAAALAVGWPLYVHLEPPDHIAQVQALLRADAALAPHAGRVHWHPQAAGDLGARMVAAVGATRTSGHDVVVLIGSDVPDLPSEALIAAREALSIAAAAHRVVFGPAADGGFYLVAVADDLSLGVAFAGVRWSVGSVLAEVTARLTASGGEVVCVAPWRDVDEPADLEALLARPGPNAPRTRLVATRLRPYNGGL